MTTPSTPVVSSHEVNGPSIIPSVLGKCTEMVKDSAKEKKAAGQKLPLGVNRFVLLGLFAIIVLLKGCTYWGWNGIQEMMYKSGKYEWVCKDVAPESITYMKVGDDKYIDCPDRKNLINGLFSTALASHLITSVISGFFLDKFGPKLTMLLAIIIDVFGWLLLFLSTEAFQGFYAGAFLLGLSADPGYLPLLFISKLFPSSISLVLSILGSLRSVSFAIPVILAAVYTSSNVLPASLWVFIVSYVGVGLGTCFIISLLFVPYKKFEDMTAEEKSTKDKSDERSQSGSKGESASSAAVQAITAPAVKSFYKILIDPQFLVIIPIFIIALIRTEFYTKSNKEQLLIMDYLPSEHKYVPGSDLYTVYSIFNILSFLPGPVMGKFVDMYGITFVLFLLNTSGVLMFIFLMINNYACKVISILFYFIYTSFVLSNVYCYIAIYFPSVYFGKLCGFVSMMGGLFIFSSVYLYTVSTDSFLYMLPYNFLPMNALLVCLGLVVYVFIFLLYRMDKKEEAEGQEMKSKV